MNLIIVLRRWEVRQLMLELAPCDLWVVSSGASCRELWLLFNGLRTHIAGSFVLLLQRQRDREHELWEQCIDSILTVETAVIYRRQTRRGRSYWRRGGSDTSTSSS